ncbi:MAG: succinate--CoA ligase subunit alpha [Bifidobacteriaceae bacterium]|jgi:succinyl-CoA synthetase alpha subunit|nr:succinate--CoA ligase subunit alpha [Bifidobacteriaceae bacterium]
MAIFLDATSGVIVQGMTGSEGTKHTGRMLNGGTAIVGGVNPRKAGQTAHFHLAPLDGSPPARREIQVYGGVSAAMAATGANVSVVFVPPAYSKNAVIEAADAGMPLVVVITEGIPVADSVDFIAYARARGTRVIGPNCPGIITPGQANVGITPADITGAGPLGLVSKSGTLTYQMMFELRDLGFSTCLGIGGDPVVGTTHVDALEAFEADPQTRAMVMIGEIGGDAEERAAEFIRDYVSKPVVAYIAGFTAPEGKTMGHAGAIVSGSSGTASAKAAALRAAGVAVGSTPSETAGLVRAVLAGC